MTNTALQLDSFENDGSIAHRKLVVATPQTMDGTGGAFADGSLYGVSSCRRAVGCQGIVIETDSSGCRL
ncbi:hypothetical protein CGZ80_06170 [Rhodopirellula sp. MGV]|nr:hypothetical protein CGZ80_06170 [Rhodopirellula sp. MGV]